MLYIHDASDVFIDLLKLANYTKLSGRCESRLWGVSQQQPHCVGMQPGLVCDGDCVRGKYYCVDLLEAVCATIRRHSIGLVVLGSGGEHARAPVREWWPRCRIV